MIIMKFGGTSVANKEAIERAIAIVKGRLPQRPVVVVSALSGVTDQLYKIADAAASSRGEQCSALIEALQSRHISLLQNLVTDQQLRAQAEERVRDICANLEKCAEAVCTLGELTPRTKAKIVSNGELLSSAVICAAMNSQGISTALVDAKEMIIADGDYMKADPLIAEICARAPQVLEKALEGRDTAITQGFIAASPRGCEMVLGRGGSDYTASLIGMALNASSIEIWTDVDGMRTTDPRRLTNTQKIKSISFEEAAEMAHFGAKVLHPLTIEPAVRKNIPVHVLNSMNPEGDGTVILQSDRIPDGVKAISFKEKVHMLNIFSTKMIDVSGFLSKVFEIFARNGVSVELISTSEANISLTVDGEYDIEPVVEQLAEFAQVKVSDDKAQVSIIGKNVVEQRGLLRWALDSINNTYIYMISQGASSVNITYVVDRNDLDEVIQELHKYLFEF